MYFKPGKSALAVAFASLLWSAQVTPANAVMVESTDIIIDDFTTAVTVSPNGTSSQSGAAILGGLATRYVFTDAGNTVVIGGGGLSVTATTSFGAAISYRMDDGGVLNLTNGGFNNGFSIGGVEIGAVDLGVSGLKWPTFDLSIIALDSGMSAGASYSTTFNPGEMMPSSAEDTLILGALFIDFSSFNKDSGFSFADVGLITVDLFSSVDPTVTFTGPFAAVSAVPLPASLPLFLSGLVGLGVIGRRRKKKAALQA